MTNKGRKFPPRPLTSAEADRLLDACGGGRVGVRNRALLVVMYRAGLRVSEALALGIDDIHRIAGGLVVYVRHPKGCRRRKNPTRPREVGLDPKATAIVEAWLVERGNGPGVLFDSARGVALLPSYVRAMLPRLARKAGITKRVHAHALRHTFARQLYDEKVGLVEIMLALGHQSLATTQSYLESIGANEVIAVTTGRNW